jgi:hypothetical protein
MPTPPPRATIFFCKDFFRTQSYLYFNNLTAKIPKKHNFSSATQMGKKLPPGTPITGQTASSYPAFGAASAGRRARQIPVTFN